LFAFSGKATAFLAPLSVALVTDIAASQRAGMASIPVFLVAGFLLLLPVRERRTA
jgi:MFS transporter, UMF1 family